MSVVDHLEPGIWNEPRENAPVDWRHQRIVLPHQDQGRLPQRPEPRRTGPPGHGQKLEPIAHVGRVRKRLRVPCDEVRVVSNRAFIIGSPVSHPSITGRLAQLTGANVFVPDYRLSPEYPFPAALEDVLACYRVLLTPGYARAQIAVAGDSAGGGLVLSLCPQLCNEGLAQPACVTVISPWANLTLTRLAPIADDALLRAAWLHQRAAAYLEGRSANGPLVSPLFADLAGYLRP